MKNILWILLAGLAPVVSWGGGHGLTQLPRPFIIAHRGSPDIYPEHTLEAYRASLADGNRFVEADCFLLADGTVGIMHDDTVDRTTTGKGRTEAQTAATWSKLRVDGSRILGGRFGKLPVPTLNELLGEFPDRAILLLEAKNRGSGRAIVEALQAHKVAKEFVLVNSFYPDELKPAIAAGYETCLNFAKEQGAAEPASLAGKGIRYLSLHKSFSADYVRKAKEAGFIVMAYTVNRQYEKVALLNKGYDGLYSDDPVYLSGIGYQLRQDPFSKRTWYPGQLVTLRGTRGGFYAPDKWGLSDAGSDVFSGVLQGWCAPFNNGLPYKELEIYFSVSVVRGFTENHGAVLLLTTEDIDWDGQGKPARPAYGFALMIGKNGTLLVERYNGGSPEVVAQGRGVPFQKDAAHEFRLSMREGKLILEDLRTGEGVSCPTAGIAPKYLTLGVRGAEAYYSHLTVTAR